MALAGRARGAISGVLDFLLHFCVKTKVERRKNKCPSQSKLNSSKDIKTSLQTHPFRRCFYYKMLWPLQGVDDESLKVNA